MLLKLQLHSHKLLNTSLAVFRELQGNCVQLQDVKTLQHLQQTSL